MEAQGYQQFDHLNQTQKQLQTTIDAKFSEQIYNQELSSLGAKIDSELQSMEDIHEKQMENLEEKINCAVTKTDT